MENAKSNVVEINNEGAFTPDPMFKLMGIFEDSDAGVSAAEDLAANNFNREDIELFCGVKGAETYDFEGDDHGVFAKFMRAFRNITFDRKILERYQSALNDGHCVLMLHIHKTARKEEAAEILHRYNSAQVDYFGLTMTENLPHKEGGDVYDRDATF